MGLNESYTQIRGQILLMDPIPSISKVFSLISQEERQRSVGQHLDHKNNSESMAFAVKGNRNNNQFIRRERNYKKDSTRERPYCNHCNIQGHTKDRCYKLHGYPPGYRHNKPKVDFTNSSTNTNAIIVEKDSRNDRTQQMLDNKQQQ